MSYKLAYM